MHPTWMGREEQKMAPRNGERGGESSHVPVVRQVVELRSVMETARR